MATPRRSAPALALLSIALILSTLASCARSSLPKDLRSALSDKGLVVEMKGNGTFRGMMVSVKNQSSETKAIRFPAGLVFARPAKEKVADMLLVKDETFELDPGASDIRLIEAYSLSYVKGAPGTETSYAASDLRMGSDPKLLGFIAWLGSEEGKALLDSSSPDADRNGQRIQSVLWFASEGLTQAEHVSQSVDVGILNEIYNSTDLGALLSLFTESERKGLDISDQGAVVNFVLQNVETLAADKAKLHRRLIDAFGDSGYAEVKKVFLSGFQDRIDEERIAVQDILDKAGIEGSY